MKNLVLTIFAIFICLSISNAQDIEVPTLFHVETEEDMKLLVSIDVGLNENGQLAFGFDGKTTTEIDSIKPYIEREINARPQFYKNIVAIEIVADKEIPMYNFEVLQEELKRLGLLKVFYVAKTEIVSKIPGIWSTGYLFRLPSRDEERIQNFYKSRNIKFRKKQKLDLVDKNKPARPMSNSAGSETSSQVPPPPPPPSMELPKVFDKEVEAEFDGFNIVIIDLDASGMYSMGNDEKLNRDEFAKSIYKSLRGNKCLFVLRKNAQVKYDNYLYTMVEIRHSIFELRDEEAMNTFKTNYNRLDYSQRSEIKSKIPFIIIDEASYIE